MIHVPQNRGKCSGRLGRMAIPSTFCIPRVSGFPVIRISEAPNCLPWWGPNGVCDLPGEERQGAFLLFGRISAVVPQSLEP